MFTFQYILNFKADTTKYMEKKVIGHKEKYRFRNFCPLDTSVQYESIYFDGNGLSTCNI